MLDIPLSAAKIYNAKAKVEAVGDEIRQATDVSVVLHYLGGREHSTAILQALHAERLELWNQHGEPALLEVETKLRHKVEGVEVGFTSTAGDVQASLAPAIVREKMALQALPAYGLELSFTVYAETTPDVFAVLWDLWADGECKVEVHEQQMSLDLAANG